MQKFVQYIFFLFFVACIAACGGGTTTATVMPKLPVPVTVDLTNLHRLMGGAVQGTPLALGNPVTVTTLAGTAVNGPLIDGSATTATFNRPNDITFDNIGKNFYVADFVNNAIREVTPLGDVTTLQCIDKVSRAAISFLNPSGITTDGTYLYVADRGYNCIRVITIVPYTGTNLHEVTTIGNTSGLAGYVDSTDRTAVLFNQPTGITTDGANIYVTDYNNDTVRWIDTSKNYAVYTLAGAAGALGTADSTGSDPSTARFNRPTRITTDGTNLYLTDDSNRTIRQIVIATAQVTTLAGSAGQLGLDGGKLDGTGTLASFRQPNGITTDGTNLYVTDTYWATIRKIVIATGAVTTLPLPGGSLLGPLGITTDGVSLFVADTNTVVVPDPKSTAFYTIYSNSILRIQ